MPSDSRKLVKLREMIRSMRSAAVAFSGGVDSTLVARIAKDELGSKAVAVTISSPLFPSSELIEAKAIAKSIGIEHLVVESNPLRGKAFVKNPPDRCYLCKKGDLTLIRRLADERCLMEVLDGSNADDWKDYRPGMKGKAEVGVISPLAEVGLGKKEIIAISKKLGLGTASKSPSPCLASRIPYGELITEEKLAMIEEAEEFLKAKGFDQVRVRMHGSSARIEVSANEVQRLASPGTRITVARKLKALGFTYVSLDLEGYRMGSMNEVLGR